MAKDVEKSLGDERTQGDKECSGAREEAAKSLGERNTLIGNTSDQLVGAEDGLELVDLAALYQVDGPIGQGGMGEVLLATEKALRRKVAIKRVRGEFARNSVALARFLTEARAVAALSHNNIVRLYAYGRDEQGPFMVMEHIDGGSLIDKCRNGALPLEEAIEITCQLCDGLATAHAAGIIHRDIKPANVLLTKSGVAKLTDFGLAKTEFDDVSLTKTGAVLGTLDFMPPEQRHRIRDADSRSDLWSLAATLYQMVTGESTRVIDLDALPFRVKSVLTKALKTKKEERYQSAYEFRDALKGIVKTEPAMSPRFSAELFAGECPSCHVGNEAHRKFCRECGEPLRCQCLKCKTEIPSWDKVCPECGGKQAELAMVRRHFAEARKHRERYDYDSAILSIEAIPEQLRSADATEFLAKLTAERHDSLELTTLIDERVQNGQLAVIVPLLERAISLRGDREDLRNLLCQLVEQAKARDREAEFQAELETALLRAKEWLGADKLSQALFVFRNMYRKAISRDEWERVRAAEMHFFPMIRIAKAGREIERSDVISLLPKAIDYCEMNPNDLAAEEFRDELLTLMGDMPASSYYGIGRFSEGAIFKRLMRVSEKAAKLLARINATLELDGVTELSDEAAEALAKNERGLWLNGLITLSDKAAEALGGNEGSSLMLKGLTTLSDRAVESLAKHCGILNLDGLPTVSDVAAEALGNRSGFSLSLGGLNTISNRSLKSLAKHKGKLYLDGLKTLSDDSAEIISKHKGSLSLKGLTTLSETAAKLLAGLDGALCLDGVSTLSLGVAELLAKHQGRLSLNGVATLPDLIAIALATHRGYYLCIDGLTALSANAAESLSIYQGESLSLCGLTELSGKAAESLARYRGALVLNGLPTLSDEAANALAKHQGKICLNGLTNLTDDAAKALSQHRGELIVNSYKLSTLLEGYSQGESAKRKS